MMVSILCLGILIIASILMKDFLRCFNVPALAGYIAIGILISLLNLEFNILDSKTINIIHFLAELGVIILLFYIGLESNLQKLLKQIWHATFMGISGVIISGVLGFLAAYFILGTGVFLSIVIGAALVATSIGISAGIWDENKAINTDSGQLLLDTAEFDDMFGVILMAVLFALGPLITDQQNTTSLMPGIFSTLVSFIIKFIIFAILCVLFARYAEKPLTVFFKNLESSPQETLTIIAIGLIIAAISGLLGFSVAIGAFFAGLIFSRDPASIKEKPVLNAVYELFVPFFFIGIGLKMQISSIGSALVPALILILAAFAGKFIGTVAPCLLFKDRKIAFLLGISMVPRAEIAMIIMQRSLELEGTVMQDYIYSAMVITCIFTCIIPPLLLNRLIPRFVRH